MVQFGFYHLTRTTVEAALPSLLGKTLAAGQRAVVCCGDAERLDAVDRALWADPDWLPHGTEHAAHQPILLGLTDARPNGAAFLFLLHGTTSAPPPGYDRVFDLFDGRDGDAVAAARRRWSAAKAAGHALTYWQQGASGWDKAG